MTDSETAIGETQGCSHIQH